MEVSFTNKACLVKDKNNQTYTIGIKRNNMFELIYTPQQVQTTLEASIINTSKRRKNPITHEELEHLHIILGHINYTYLTKMLSLGLVKTGIRKVDNWIMEEKQKNQIQNNEDKPLLDTNHIETTSIKELYSHDGTKCLICDAAKMTKKPFYTTDNPATHINERLGSDLTGPITPQGIGKVSYVMIVVDFYTKFVTVKCLNNKALWLSELKQIVSTREIDHKTPIRAIRCDNGELSSLDSMTWAREKTPPIKMEFIPPKGSHHEMGGGYERYFRTLFEIVIAMLLMSGLPNKFWPHAVQHACHLKNIWYSPSHGKTPHEMETGQTPDISQLHPFGCLTKGKSFRNMEHLQYIWGMMQQIYTKYII